MPEQFIAKLEQKHLLSIVQPLAISDGFAFVEVANEVSRFRLGS